MAVKTSDLYSSLWAACNELRGGLDASQYKDYILPLLFLKYATDKYLNDTYSRIKVFDKEHDEATDPDRRTGCSFTDLIALKRQNGIGEGIDKVFARFAEVNPNSGLDGIARFNDEAKMGSGKEQIDRLTRLIEIFQSDDFDFSKNTAEADDVLGDAFETLLQLFAAEAGKSKGQFYTPDGAARVLAHASGITKCDNRRATIYDPACGSSSLIMKTIDAAPKTINGAKYNPKAYGQEKDISTASLSKMNALIHGHNVEVRTGNTMTKPLLTDGGTLRQYDYIVCNPPYSMSAWATGIEWGTNDYGRFSQSFYGALPPDGNGDYAWLMHIIASMTPNGHAAVVLPLGVLFRGKAEATIRKAIVKKGYITSITALSPNLFYGTGIPVVILGLSKANTADGILFIDASTMFVKDKDKNRLRERDIKKICDLLDSNGQSDPRYARFVKYGEIEKNDYNLNVSLYIEPLEKPVVEDIEGHLHGGIPDSDLDRLDDYFKAFEGIRDDLFEELRPGYSAVKTDIASIREAVEEDPRVKAHGERFAAAVAKWKSDVAPILETLPERGVSARETRTELASITMEDFEGIPVIDAYDAYEVFMRYWQETMKDDVGPVIGYYDEITGELIGENGFDVVRDIKVITNTKGKETGWEGTFLPKDIVKREKIPMAVEELENIDSQLAFISSEIEELVSETREGSMLAELLGEDGKVPNKKTVDDFIAEKRGILTTPDIEALEELHRQLAEKLLTSAKEKKDWLASNPQAAKALGDVKPNRNDVAKHIKSLRAAMSFPTDEENADITELERLSALLEHQKAVSDERKQVSARLDLAARDLIETATGEDLRDLMVDGKWLAELEAGLMEVEKIAIQEFTTRLDDLSTRYASSLVQMENDVKEAGDKVKADLARLGIEW